MILNYFKQSFGYDLSNSFSFLMLITYPETLLFLLIFVAFLLCFYFGVQTDYQLHFNSNFIFSQNHDLLTISLNFMLAEDLKSTPMPSKAVPIFYVQM